MKKGSNRKFRLNFSIRIKNNKQIKVIAVDKILPITILQNR